jgi:hypothetical protein
MIPVCWLIHMGRFDNLTWLVGVTQRKSIIQGGTGLITLIACLARHALINSSLLFQQLFTFTM